MIDRDIEDAVMMLGLLILPITMITVAVISTALLIKYLM